MHNFDQLRDHCRLTRRYFLQLGSLAAAAWNASPLAAVSAAPDPLLNDAIAKLEYLAPLDRLLIADKGRTGVLKFSPEKLREVGLVPETWSLEVVPDTESTSVVEQPLVKEIDINPLLASDKQLIALDARVVLHEPGIKDEDLPRPSIRPYPHQYEDCFRTKAGEDVLIRPIRPEDEPMMVHFHESLSERTVYQRYLQMLNLPQRTAHERLVRICFIDYARQMALVVERAGPDGRKQIIGVGRLQNLLGPGDAEFSIVISDDHQKDGLGTELLNRLIDIGRREGVKVITADILAENMAMQKVCEKAGFKLVREFGEPVVSARLEMQ